MHSAYDYVVSETLGFHVDYEKTLGQQYEELKSKGETDLPILEQHRLDSLREKCENAILDMHRPIVKSETAVRAEITGTIGGRSLKFDHPLSRSTFEFARETITSEAPSEFVGRVTSYNTNTYKGRIYVPNSGRPIPFKLTTDARDLRSVSLVTESLVANGQDPEHQNFRAGFIICKAFKNTSRSGQLKSIDVVEVGIFRDDVF